MTNQNRGDPLPGAVLDLMERTVKLVDLLYWKPMPTEGSHGEAEYVVRMEDARRNPGREARPDPAKTIERGSSEERDTMEDIDGKAYVQALMSDIHGAFPFIFTNPVHLRSHHYPPC